MIYAVLLWGSYVRGWHWGATGVLEALPAQAGGSGSRSAGGHWGPEPQGVRAGSELRIHCPMNAAPGEGSWVPVDVGASREGPGPARLWTCHVTCRAQCFPTWCLDPRRQECGEPQRTWWLPYALCPGASCPPPAPPRQTYTWGNVGGGGPRAPQAHGSSPPACCAHPAMH